MDLADWVFANGLDVEVQGYCFSSCANYVLPAGKNKFLSQYAQLGWHGGASQPFEFDDEEMRQAYQAYIGSMQERERAFFKKIGVNPAITTLGQSPEYAAYSHCVGWGYTRSKLRELGVQNVIYPDGIWQPAPSFEGKCIFTIGS